ncbi:MAG TPA: hypothetical protein VN578_15170 [Candidatus Binatia bacterium]|jgi:hypothetical protein|nr:hypothetical protein [Candidatus Binatia bacterium]
MKKTLLVLALAAPVTLFTGCATHQGAYPPVDTTVGNLENNAQFVLLDPGAQRSVTCPGIQQARLDDGRLQVLANLRNRENRRIQVQVDCVFKDAQDFDVEETPFVNVFLDENAMQGVKFVSMNDKAQRYTIRVREAR